MAAVASTAKGGAALLTVRAAADGLAARRLCTKVSTPVNSAKAPAWWAAPRETGTYVSSVVMPSVTWCRCRTHTHREKEGSSKQRQEEYNTRRQHSSVSDGTASGHTGENILA